MRCLLFRRMNIEGVNYYQLYKIEENFTPDESFGDYDSRMDKEFFYIEDNNVTSDSLYTLFYDNEEGFFDAMSLSDAEMYVKIFNEFKNKYHDINGTLSIKELKDTDALVNIISQRIMFEEEGIRSLVERIYTNELILGSNLPDELKKIQKRNILLHGASGTGKNTIVDILKENLDFPYADVKVEVKSPETFLENINYVILKIISELLESSERIAKSSGMTPNTADISNGIVFIRDNFKELLEVYNNNPDVFSVLDQITKQEVIEYKGVKIDFSKLTFVILYNELYPIDDYELTGLGALFNCQYHVSIKSLTNKQKYELLLSPNGRIVQYANFLNKHGKKFTIDETYLKKLIRETSKVDRGMNTLNMLIDMLVKKNIDTDIHDVILDKENYELLINFLDTKEDVGKKENTNKKDVLENVLSVVKGQDEAVKKLIYHVKKNLEMANKNDLKYPEKYIKKILLRGETGSGKSLLLNMIARNFDVPIYIADATKFTESGYIGSSINDMLLGLLRAAHGDKEKAERGILVIDEIDKKSNDGNIQDISRGAVQNELLTLFDGATIDITTKDNEGNTITIPFDTSRLTIICSGAFEDIEKIRDQRVKRQSGGVGFSNAIITDDEKKISSDDYVNYGMMRQLMGRMPIIIYLNKHDKDSIINISKNSLLSPLKIEEKIINEDGIEVEYRDDFYPKFADKVLKLKIGARGIERALQNLLSDIHIENINSDEVSKIIFTGECVDNPEKIIIVPRIKEKVYVKKFTKLTRKS